MRSVINIDLILTDKQQTLNRIKWRGNYLRAVYVCVCVGGGGYFLCEGEEGVSIVMSVSVCLSDCMFV